MSDLSFIDNLSEQDIDALLEGNVDNISDEGITLLDSLSDEQFGALIGAEPAEKEPETPQGTRNLSGALEGIGLSKEQADAFADSSVANFFQGIGREASAITRGLQQLASTPEEAAVLASVEERERKIFAELDDRGFGAEDIGQALPMLATIIAPGGQVVAGANAAVKGLGVLSRLGSTLGAQAATVAAIEGSKAVTMEESRAINAASGAAATVVGGKLVGGLGKSLHAGAIGRMLTVAGLGAIAKGEAGRRASGGLMSFINRKLLGRETKNVGQELSQRAAAGIAGPESRRIIERGTSAQIELAKQSGGLAAGRSEAWDAFLDIVKGPVSPKTGKRLIGKSLAGGAAPKAAKESGIDVIAERNRIVGVLMEAAKRPRPDQPNVVDFDASALETAWRKLKDDDSFRALYMGKSGALNQKGKAVEDLLDSVLKQGQPSDPTVLINELVENGLGQMRRQADEAIQGVARATQSKVEKGFKLSPADVAARAAAANLATIIDQNGGWAESLERIKNGDTWEWIDVTSTIQEQLDEINAASSNP